MKVQVHGVQAWCCMKSWFIYAEFEQALPPSLIHSGDNKIQNTNSSSPL
jgi:hypothetical protein